MDCKQGPDISLIKPKQKLLTLLSTYKAYGGSIALPAIIKRVVTKASYTEASQPIPDQTDALRKKANAKVQSRIFLNSLNIRYDDFVRGVENAY